VSKKRGDGSGVQWEREGMLAKDVDVFLVRWVLVVPSLAHKTCLVRMEEDTNTHRQRERRRRNADYPLGR